jgi:hypothetical protein
MTEKQLLREFIDEEKERINLNLYEINRGYKVTLFQEWSKECELKIKAFETLLKKLK